MSWKLMFLVLLLFALNRSGNGSNESEWFGESLYLPEVPDHVAELMKSAFSEIFCAGPILDAIQNAHLFNDSKYFVDMSLKKDPISTLTAFRELGDKIFDRAELARFLVEYFDPPETELVECTPMDWVPVPLKFHKVKNYDYREWLLDLHYQWADLCRQVRPEVRDHPHLFTSIYVPYPFIIPGGRFREFYYWDSYWILKGLFFSELYSTARGMMRNMAYLVANNGFVPNGGRVYLLSRSQPPLLIPMVKDYYTATEDEAFVREMLPYLEEEFKFWLRHRSYALNEGGNECSVFRYGTQFAGPRPESYREDLELVKHILSEQARMEMWSDIAAAAESGWDFSTRWFSPTGPSSFEIRSIRTRGVVPVDLNAFMCMNARTLAELYEIVDNKRKSREYRTMYDNAVISMTNLYWNDDDGIWYDVDGSTMTQMESFYISNVAPLYAKCYNTDNASIPKRVYQYLKGQGVFTGKGGIPTSFVKSAQQWDGANAWPPMIHMLVEGFRISGDPELEEVAKNLATQWIGAVYRSYRNSSEMFEKYNISMEDFTAGSGGEYIVQTGFGWTNGVIMDFLDKFGDTLQPVPPEPSFWDRVKNVLRPKNLDIDRD